MNKIQVHTTETDTHRTNRFLMNGEEYKSVKICLSSHDYEVAIKFCPSCHRVIGGGSIYVKAGNMLTFTCPSCYLNI